MKRTPKAPWSRLKEFAHFLAFEWAPLLLSACAGVLAALALPGGHKPFDFIGSGIVSTILFAVTLAGSPRMALVPSWFPTDPNLTEKANAFAKESGTRPVTVHVALYGEGCLAPFAFRKGDRVLISLHLLEHVHPDQVDFIIAREVVNPPRLWMNQAKCFGFFFLGFIGQALRGTPYQFLILLLAVPALAAIVLTNLATPRAQWNIDVKAIRITRNMDAALATLALLPWITQWQSKRDDDLELRQENLIRSRPENVPPLFEP